MANEKYTHSCGTLSILQFILNQLQNLQATERWRNGESEWEQANKRAKAIKSLSQFVAMHACMYRHEILFSIWWTKTDTHMHTQHITHIFGMEMKYTK